MKTPRLNLPCVWICSVGCSPVTFQAMPAYTSSEMTTSWLRLAMAARSRRWDLDQLEPQGLEGL